MTIVIKQNFFGDKQDLFNNGWEELNNQLFCKDCLKLFNSLEYEVAEEEYIICLIDDDSRHLVKGEEYRVNELIFLSAYADEKAKNNLAIYVDTGRGWQSRLDKGQYKLV